MGVVFGREVVDAEVGGVVAVGVVVDGGVAVGFDGDVFEELAVLLGEAGPEGGVLLREGWGGAGTDLSEMSMPAHALRRSMRAEASWRVSGMAPGRGARRALYREHAEVRCASLGNLSAW
ncbi:MAG: hypothetical protein AAF500_18990 [Myxococcota bacterium]